MPSLLKNRFFIITVVILIGLIAITFFSAKQGPEVTPVEGVIGNVFTTLQKAVYTVINEARSIVDNIAISYKQGQNINLLQKKVDELEQQNSKLSELEQENQRLKGMLDFKEANPQLVVSGARVIAKDSNNWFDIFIIDKGSSDGITVDMAVVNEKGLVGRTTEVSEHWSKVMSIIDERSSVSIIAKQTRDNGVARGMLVAGSGMDADLLKVLYFPLDSKIKKGDEIITSGLGGVFPKGIRVGTVQNVKKTMTGEIEYVMIKPYVDFLRLEEVMIIKSTVGEIKVAS